MWKWRIARNAIFYSSSAICTSPITRLVCPPPQKFFHNPCTLFPLGITVVLRDIKDWLCKTRSTMEDVKWRILPFSFLTFLLFTKRANLTRIYKIFRTLTLTLTLIKTGWKNRHVDNCGCYENDVFCEICEFGKDSSKVWQKISMRQQKRPIGSWQFSRKLQIRENSKNPSKLLQNLNWGGKEGNLDKWRLYENDKFWAKKGNFGKNGEYTKKSSRLLPNIQVRWQKGASWQMAILRKLQKRHTDSSRFSRKWQIWENGELGKNPSKVRKASIEVTKRLILTNGDYNKKMGSHTSPSVKRRSRRNFLRWWNPTWPESPSCCWPKISFVWARRLTNWTNRCRNVFNLLLTKEYV